MKKILISLTVTLLIFPFIMKNSDVQASSSNQSPNLKVYQDGTNVKLEWAIEMLDEDVLYQTGFETNDELPELTYNSYGNRKYGGQSLVEEDKFGGEKSLKIVDSYTNGNYKDVDLNGKETYRPWSAAIFSNRKYMSNGTDLSVSFRAKTNGNGNVEIYGSGGYADYGQPLSITFLEDVSEGDLTARVSNPSFFQRYVNEGRKYYLASMKGKYKEYIHVTNVDMDTSTITVNKAFQGDFKKGDRVLKHNFRSPVTFNTRNLAQNDGWALFNVNTKVEDYADYNTLANGFELWIRTTTNDTVYVDDLKLGYATKAQLYRGNTQIYEGFLSDFTDTKATDKTKPEKVKSYSVQKENDKTFISIQQSKDIGTVYDYSVGATAHDGTFYKSDTKSVQITSGIKGYSYVIDNKKDTIPGTTVNTETGTVEVPINANQNSYLHIRTIDKAGNAADTAHFPLKDVVQKKLEATIPSIKPLESIVLQDQPVTYKTSFNSSFHIQNYYPGSDEGWRLSVSASQLKLLGDSYMLPPGTISLEPLSEINSSENRMGNLPLKVMSKRSVIDNGEVTVASSKSGDGIGDYELAFPEDALNIVIDPTTAKTGRYQATLTWDLISAP